jgi:hypothetical protein
MFRPVGKMNLQASPVGGASADSRDTGMSAWKITEQGLRNDAGFIVEAVGRSKVKYKESERTITVGVEDGSGDIVYVYLKPVTHWDPPHDSESLSPDRKEQLRERLRDYFRFEELTARFEE